MYGDLPLTSLEKFKGSINQFIVPTLDEAGQCTQLIINPKGQSLKVIEDKGNAINYMKATLAMLGLKTVTASVQLRLPLETNVGYTGGAGVAFDKNDKLRTVVLKDRQLVLQDTVTDSYRIARAEIIRTIANHQVRIDTKEADATGLANFIVELLNTADAEQAEAMRAKAIEERRQAQDDYRAAREGAQDSDWVMPKELYTTVDGVPVDLLTLPKGTLLYARKDNGTYGKPYFRAVRKDRVTIEWFKNRIDEGRDFRTAPHS